MFEYFVEIVKPLGKKLSTHVQFLFNGGQPSQSIKRNIFSTL
jgi:hypothetical protein